MAKPKDAFDLSCPDGGALYVCEGLRTEFVGCCTVDACALQGSCPMADVRPMSFSQDLYQELPPLECVDNASLWYTCKFTPPPFAGCCRSNPCVDFFCPQENLTQAELTSDETNRRLFLSSPLPGATQTPTVTAGSDQTVTPPVSDANVEEGGGGGLSAGAIAGIAVGVFVALLVLLAILMWRCGWIISLRRRTKNVVEAQTTEQQQLRNGTGAMTAMSQTSPYQDSFTSPLSYYRDAYKHASIGGSPPHGHQFGSPHASMQTDGTITSSYHNRQTPSLNAMQGVHGLGLDPQELPVQHSSGLSELPVDGAGHGKDTLVASPPAPDEPPRTGG